MKEYELFKKLENVKAPPRFEQQIMQMLSLRKKKHARIKTLRFSLAGAFSAAAVTFIILNLFILPQKGTVEYSGLRRGRVPAGYQQRATPSVSSPIPLIETVDYSGEIPRRRQDPPTIYILEQCSDKRDLQIRY